MAWVPIGAGQVAAIDWGTFGARERVDPYLAWHDFTGFLGKAVAPKQIPLILELREPLSNKEVLDHLNALGLLITPHYVNFKYPNQSAPHYVTAVCVNLQRLDRFVRAVATRKDKFVVRYEISSGMRNPDAVILEGSGQRWDPPPSPIPTVESNLVGFIDYGCAFLHQSFRDSKGKGRVQHLWNQQVEDSTLPAGGRKALAWRPNGRFACGNEVDAAALLSFSNQYQTVGGLDELACYRDADYEPIRRCATHGTHIMDVATGFPDPTLHRRNQGSLHEASIVFVQLPRLVGSTQVSGLLRAQVLDAAHYIAGHLSVDYRGVINLSYGSNCGPHDGSSILERGLDELIEGHIRRKDDDTPPVQHLHMVVPSGNALDRSVHAQLHLRTGEVDTLRWEVMPDDPSDSFVELWVPYPQTAETPEPPTILVRAIPPGGTPSGWVEPGRATRLEYGGNTVAMLICAAVPCQSESGAMTLLALAPTSADSDRAPAPYGEWRIEIRNASRGSLLVNAWCERDDPVFGNEGGPRQAQFNSHIEKTGTLNSIAHGRKTIVVGGYEAHDFAARAHEGPVAPMSGTGPGRDLPGRARHPTSGSGAAARGPQVLTPCLLGLGEDGIAGAAVLSGDQLNLTGTSVSAACYTRAFIKAGFNPPSQRPVKSATPKPFPGRDLHPDDGEGIDRVP